MPANAVASRRRTFRLQLFGNMSSAMTLYAPHHQNVRVWRSVVGGFGRAHGGALTVSGGKPSNGPAVSHENIKTKFARFQTRHDAVLFSS